MSSTTPKYSIGPMHSVGIAPRVIDPMHSTAVAPRVIDYPETDGQPMAETPEHRDVMIDAIQVLRRHFAGRPDVYVSGNMMMYYEEGEPRRCVSPDVFVAVGVEDKDRRTYLLWREAKGPDFVLEVTSKSTRRNDQVTKRALYEWMGVSEYVLYDPLGEYLSPSLQGFALSGGRYVELERRRLSGGARALHSEVLGLSLHVRARDRALRLHDPVSGEDLLTPVEAAAARLPPGKRPKRAPNAKPLPAQRLKRTPNGKPLPVEPLKWSMPSCELACGSSIVSRSRRSLRNPDSPWRWRPAVRAMLAPCRDRRVRALGGQRRRHLRYTPRPVPYPSDLPRPADATEWPSCR